MVKRTKTLVVDNGAFNIKAGFAAPETSLTDCHVIPNCLARGRDRTTYIGADLAKCRDFGTMAYRRPVERGYLVNWESEKEIWDHCFQNPKSALNCDPKSTALILTEAPNTPAVLQTNCDQMIFEEYEFGAYYRCVGASLVPWANIPLLYDYNTPPRPEPTCHQAVLVVDSGYSFTHIIPVIEGSVWNAAVRRIDVGGKFLTNYLKEMVSVRHYFMMEETHIMNEVKETVSFISKDFNADLEKCKKVKQNDIVVDYVLPDYNANKSGFVRPHVPKQGGKLQVQGKDKEEVMTLGNERFTVPELLFSPSDVGHRQAGVAESVMQSLAHVPDAYRNALLANIVLVGGNVKIPGFVERFTSELRPLAPSEAEIRIGVPEDPTKYVWQGGASLALNKTALEQHLVSREDYLEHGSAWCARRMGGLEEPVVQPNTNKRRKTEN